MSSAKYVPLRVAIPNRTTGEIREFEINYSDLTMDKAFQAQRDLQYLDAAIRQWLVLLKQLVERSAENDGYAIKKEERMRVTE